MGVVRMRDWALSVVLKAPRDCRLTPTLSISPEKISKTAHFPPGLDHWIEVDKILSYRLQEVDNHASTSHVPSPLIRLIKLGILRTWWSLWKDLFSRWHTLSPVYQTNLGFVWAKINHCACGNSPVRHTVAREPFIIHFKWFIQRFSQSILFQKTATK